MKDRFPGSEVSRWLDAAAVLAAFDPFQLRPMGRVPDDPEAVLLEHVLSRCEPITQGDGQGLWRLSLPERRAALRRLGSHERMRKALAANPERVELVSQRLFERLIEQRTIALDGLSRDELSALFDLRDWVDGIMDGLPDPAWVSRALAMHDLLAPMRRLTEDDFVGRTLELRLIREYLDRPRLRDPLFVHGPGGIGKSTLLACAILEFQSRGHIVYVDLDRPTIRPKQQATLLLDFVKQLQPQLDADPKSINALTEEITFGVNRADASRVFEAFGSASPLRGVGFRLASLLTRAPVLIVVDTFEEAQFLGVDVVSTLLNFLERLGDLIPTSRLILAGRALPDGEWSQTINLGVLDQGSARRLLQSSIKRAGLTPLFDDELDEIIGVVTLNPMCLKLAARLLRDEGVDKLRASRSEFLTMLKAEKIQALLYGRILRQLHDERVRAVAHPGLVVRRVTPEVISEVLAGPCELRLGLGEEHTVFAALEGESTLVEHDPEDGSLRHRADVRRVMLEDLLDHVPAEVVERIDLNAVSYYATREDPVSRGEEIYHRLRLRQPEETLEARWTPASAHRLKNAGEELPARQRLWLARKLGITLDESVRRTASQQEWEDQVARSAERYLLSKVPGQALATLRERPARLPRSRLFFLEAEALRFLDRPDEALRVARAGVESASVAGAVDMALELLLQMEVIEEGRGDHASAGRLLAEATAVSMHSSNRLLRFRVSITDLRLRRHTESADPEETGRLAETAVAELNGGLLDVVRDHPVLLREAAAELDDPRIIAAAIETLGIEVTTDMQAEALGQAIVILNGVSAPGVELPFTFTHGAERFEATRFDADVVRGWVANEVTGADIRMLGSIVGRSGVLDGFNAYFQAGVDQSLQGPDDTGDE